MIYTLLINLNSFKLYIFIKEKIQQKKNVFYLFIIEIKDLIRSK